MVNLERNQVEGAFQLFMSKLWPTALRDGIEITHRLEDCARHRLQRSFVPGHLFVVERPYVIIFAY